MRMGCVCGKETLEINGKNYVVRAKLGEGGFSNVDLVEEVRTHRSYALKRILVHSGGDEDDTSKALAEVEHCRRVDHPNVIKCVDYAVKDTVAPSTRHHLHGTRNQASSRELLILLPFYGRGTLQDEIERRSALKHHFREVSVLQKFKKICAGVMAMHNAEPQPLAHRDLKPGNVLLANDFSPIVMDLGSAGPARVEIRTPSEAKSLEDFASQHCSMLYRPPELFHVDTHAIIDERTDVWSLGCVLYALCFFKSPFEAAYERGDSVALAVQNGRVNIAQVSRYSQGLQELILSMIVVDANQRPFLNSVLHRIDELLISYKRDIADHGKPRGTNHIEPQADSSLK